MRNRHDRTGDLAQKSPTLKDKLTSMMWGLAGGALAVLVTNVLVINSHAERDSSRDVDTLEKRQGSGSLRWNFHLRPERRFVFSIPGLSGALLHAETIPNDQGDIPSMDWQEFRTMRFFAKSSAAGFVVNEVNVFVGQGHRQYVFDQPSDLSLSTDWRQIDIPFARFRLAPWVPGSDRALGSRLAQITAFGFDIKNRTLDLQGSVWIDFVRLVRQDGSVAQLSDGDSNSFDFEGHALTWFAAVREY